MEGKGREEGINLQGIQENKRNSLSAVQIIRLPRGIFPSDEPRWRSFR